MAQIETTGGGISYTPDGKKITKKVYLLTAGETSVTLPAEDGVLTAVDFQNAEANTRRVTAQWTLGMAGSGSSSVGSGGETVELVGGSREVPVQSHPTFADVTDEQRTEIEAAIQDSRAPSESIVPSDGRARQLYNLLLTKREFYLAPAVALRVTTYEGSLPSLRELCTVNAPSQGPAVGGSQNWLLTAINSRTVAQPTGATQYEVTREWTLSDGNGWDPEQLIYNGT